MDNNNNDTYQKESNGVAMNLFAIIGFIAILIAGLWATMQIIDRVKNSNLITDDSSISSTLNTNTEDMYIKSTSSAYNSGVSSDIIWDFKENVNINKQDTVTFSYACTNGIYIKTLNKENGRFTPIPCNSSYNVNANNKRLSIIPVITNNKKINQINYSLKYNPTNKNSKEITISGTLNITNKVVTKKSDKQNKTDKMQNNEDTNIITTKQNPKKDNTQTKHYTKRDTSPKYKTVKKYVPAKNSDINGFIDLNVKILSVTPTLDNKLDIRFTITNMGTKAVKDWTFTAILPTDPGYTYVSAPQQILYQAETIELSMTFDKWKNTYPRNIDMFVDYTNSIPESNESNNYARFTF